MCDAHLTLCCSVGSSRLLKAVFIWKGWLHSSSASSLLWQAWPLLICKQSGSVLQLALLPAVRTADHCSAVRSRLASGYLSTCLAAHVHTWLAVLD
jgi:hypothetical protein